MAAFKIVVVLGVMLAVGYCQELTLEDCHAARAAMHECMSACAAEAGCAMEPKPERNPPEHIAACKDVCKPAPAEGDPPAERPSRDCFRNRDFRACKQQCKADSGVDRRECRRLMCECLADAVDDGVCDGPAPDCDAPRPFGSRRRGGRRF